jgi:hypothetical protein
MDELEISGKRYISSRRAGKEHKYHPDYIGQLVRAGKVNGQKVGRAWYVDADSLARYLSQDLGPREPIQAIQSIQPKEEKIIVTEVEEIAEPVTQIVKTEIVEEPIQIVEAEQLEEKEAKIQIHTDTHIQKKTEGLTYLSDDAPLFPAIKKHAVPMTTMPAQLQEYAVEKYQEPARILVHESKRIAPKKSTIIKAGIALILLGCASFAITAALSTGVVSTIHIQNGQPASVYYSLK